MFNSSWFVLDSQVYMFNLLSRTSALINLFSRVPIRRVESLRKKLFKEGRLREYMREQRLRKTFTVGLNPDSQEPEEDFMDVSQSHA